MYADYLRDSNAFKSHKHLMPPEAQPPVQVGVPRVLGGGLAFKNTPKQRQRMLEKAEKRAQRPANYIRNEVIREIQIDLQLA